MIKYNITKYEKYKIQNTKQNKENVHLQLRIQCQQDRIHQSIFLRFHYQFLPPFYYLYILIVIHTGYYLYFENRGFGQVMGNSQAKLLLVGLDNSGKTTILSRIVDPTRMDTQITPTIGYKKQTFTHNGIDYQVFDMSGQSKYRNFWQQNASYTANKIDGIIFVIDASDKLRINVARSELQLLLQNKDIFPTIPYLFYANKSDMKGSCSLKEVAEIMQLEGIKRQYKIFSCSGLSGQGVQEGIIWFTSLIKSKRQSKE